VAMVVVRMLVTGLVVRMVVTGLVVRMVVGRHGVLVTGLVVRMVVTGLVVRMVVTGLVVRMVVTMVVVVVTGVIVIMAGLGLAQFTSPIRDIPSFLAVQTFRQTTFVVVISWIAWATPSRPRPDPLTPPNGIASIR
jgi:hypothetical protein